MKRILLLLLLILIVTGIGSPISSNFKHAFKDEVAYTAGNLRSESHISEVAFLVIVVTNRSPYLLPSKLVQSDNQEIISLEQKITKGKKTDEAKSLAIYNWVTHNISYKENSPSFQSSMKTLSEGCGICTDFAILNAALHRAAGIEAKIVYDEMHAWNQVKIGKTWVDQDPTFGSGYMDENTHKFVKQYNEQYFSQTERRWEGEFKF